MGRSYPVRYTVEMSFVYLQGANTCGYSTPTPWPGKYVGRVSDKNLAKVVASFVASLRDGECNDHLLKRAGIIGVWRAIVRDSHKGGAIVATWERK